MSNSLNQQGVLVSAAGGRPILTSQYLQQHKVGTSGKDVIWQPLRDQQAYASTGGTSFKFFSEPIGGGSTAAFGALVQAKTEFDTNVEIASLLGQGNEFYQIGLEFLYLPGITAASTTATLLPGAGDALATNIGEFVNDVYAIGAGGLVTERIGTNRDYIQDGPLNLFPPATRLVVAAALSAIAPTTQATQENFQINYAAWGGEPYVIVPIYIASLQKFTLSLQFAAAIPTPSGTAGLLIARARGYYIRQVT